jgi:apolipoprotein N-acyltransferase
MAALACLVFALLYFVVLEAAAGIGRRRPALAPLALPALWVGADLVRAAIPGLREAWFPLYAHTQTGNVALLQVASWGGVHAVTFAAVGIPAAAAYWLRRPLHPLRAAWAAIFLAAYAAMWWGGAGALEPPAEERGNTLTIACVQNGVVADAETYDFLRDYEEMTAAALPLAGSGRPAVAVWPETFFTSYEDKMSREAVASLARRLDVYIVYHCYEKAAGGFYNVAVLMDPRGREVLKWRKRNPAPGETSLKPGEEEPYGVYEAPWGGTGLLVCYDDYFPAEARRLAVAGARVILIPSNDHGYGDDYFYRVHLNQALFRAVENRCAVAVAGYDGYSAVIDDAGRLQAFKGDHGRGYITAAVAAGRGEAFYTRHPRVFPGLVAVLALIVVAGAGGRRRE